MRNVPRMKLAVVIVNYRTPDLTLAAVRSLSAERDATMLHVYVVDNESGDGSAETLKTALAKPEFATWATVLPQVVNGGFGWGNNQAVLHIARGGTAPEQILFLNPDTEVQPGAVAALSAALDGNPDCAIAGAAICAPDGSASSSAFRAPSIGREFIRASHLARLGYALGIAATDVSADSEADWVSGSAFIARWSALEDIGLFDDGFFLYFEEIELMARMRAKGWRIRSVADARVMHREGGATGMAGGGGLLPPYWHRSRRRYFALMLGERGAVRADTAFRWGSRIGALRGRSSPDTSENLKRMADAAALPVVPPNIVRIGDEPGRQPAWMQHP